MSGFPPLLEVDDLAVTFRSGGSTVRAVDGVSFTLERGATLGIVGESGCGKSVTSLALLRLIRGPAGRIERGRILFEGRDLLTLPEEEMRGVRGGQIAMIFQDPMTSLNPVLTIGRQLTETIELHLRLPPRAARGRALELLATVGIPSPAARIDDYPHQFSGGMRQRAMIAMAVSCRPKLLIADEPTTALDVTIQAQILELIARLQAELQMAVILITHDLGVVAGCADRIAVMYAGRIVEEGPTEAVFEDPRMPYTRGLLGSIPSMEDPLERVLQPIRGQPPDLARAIRGCPFAPRCAYVRDACRHERPGLRPVGLGHHAACLVDLGPVPAAAA